MGDVCDSVDSTGAGNNSGKWIRSRFNDSRLADVFAGWNAHSLNAWPDLRAGFQGISFCRIIVLLGHAGSGV